jgi:hypothetical protein
MRALACLVLLLGAAVANAGDKTVYRFVDKNGRAHYTDQPPYRGAKPLVLANQATPTARRKWEDAASAEIIRKATRYAVHFNAPSPDQIYADPAPGVSVAVSVMPGLAKGLGLLFKVDGKLQGGAPLNDIHTVLHGIGAGDHQLTAVLISAEGRELAHSTPVSIRVKAALAKN